MGAMKTPGVYIVEKNAFPNSVVEVATAVPVFIGYTEKAVDGTVSLLNKPRRITSMGEFHNCFGMAPTLKFKIEEGVTEPPAGKEVLNVKITDARAYHITVPPCYNLYYHLLLFYANGGGPCYVVSVGKYDDATGPQVKALKEGITPLLKEQEPTMMVIPEAVNLPQEECYALQQEMLKHCGYVMRNRFAILDVWGGMGFDGESVSKFREGIGGEFLAFGAAYFPWVKSSILSVADLSYGNIVGWDDWVKGAAGKMDVKDKVQSSLKGLIDRFVSDLAEKVEDGKDDAGNPLTGDRTEEEKNMLRGSLHAALLQNWGDYKILLEAIRERLNLLPPSAAMAGVYTMVDNTRGVWKAPANVSVANVTVPSANITNAEQEDLNVPMNGKAINAIRFFVGDGIKVWGARTLDGNSLDWRYINVRRTMIFLEESVKNAARAYVFEPNDANTWMNIKSMIENFLRGVWKRGGLAGASPEGAFSVHVGLGDTMTPEDILEGILRVTVLVALSRPAEFIEITFQQQMQES